MSPRLTERTKDEASAAKRGGSAKIFGGNVSLLVEFDLTPSDGEIRKELSSIDSL